MDAIRRTFSIKLGLISGSPPVRRTVRTPRFAATLTIRSISSGVSTDCFGIQGTPSAGMQYVQRSEHLSVREIRRSR